MVVKLSVPISRGYGQPTCGFNFDKNRAIDVIIKLCILVVYKM